MKRCIIGIDEAGRGPLAGPVSVGTVLFPPNFNWKLIQGVRDSKQLSPQAREEWYARLLKLEREKGVRFAVGFASAAAIDSRGISVVIKECIKRNLLKLEAVPDECTILLDGSLKAPPEFVQQKTIIRGDQTEPAISLASIAAKVERDALMRSMAKKYPRYGFDIHKGYGTKKHCQAIVEFGLSDMHRKTFCRKFTSVV